jgi:hypothetical protein
LRFYVEPIKLLRMPDHRGRLYPAEFYAEPIKLLWLKNHCDYEVITALKNNLYDLPLLRTMHSRKYHVRFKKQFPHYNIHTYLVVSG